MSDLTEAIDIAWGYSMADIERIAWSALRRSVRSMGCDLEDRYETAWGTIVELLFKSSEAPAFHELYKAALVGLSELARERQHLWGTDTRTGDGAAPRFSTYWLPPRHQRGNDGFSDHLVEVMSLPTVLGVLSDAEYEAMITLAAYDGDQRRAAEALGLSYSTFYHRIEYGRRKVKAAWFDHETPPSTANRADACRVGHLRSEHGKRRGNTWVCRKCQNIADRRYRRKRKALAEAAA